MTRVRIGIAAAVLLAAGAIVAPTPASAAGFDWCQWYRSGSQVTIVGDRGEQYFVTARLTPPKLGTLPAEPPPGADPDSWWSAVTVTFRTAQPITVTVGGTRCERA